MGVRGWASAPRWTPFSHVSSCQLGSLASPSWPKCPRATYPLLITTLAYIPYTGLCVLGRIGVFWVFSECVCGWKKAVCVAQEGKQRDSCETSALVRCIVSPLTPRLCFQQGVSVEIQKDLQSQWRQLQVQHNAGSTWVHTRQSFTLCNGLSHPSVAPLPFELTLVLLWNLHAEWTHRFALLCLYVQCKNFSLFS